ncbi:MAG: sugar transferase [Gemmatimonadetes bacterium]|nr:sugar transferase [Gemmatimonadota bacterium]
MQQRLKRGIDLVFAFLSLVVLAPVFAVSALLVKIGSRGPVIYRWRAMGRGGRPFVSYKFRTMVENADELKAELLPLNEMRGPVFKIRNDPRITPVGRWLRRFSIDELPQLWSVLKGDMSLVGPRPPFPEEFAQFESWQWAKLAVTPGMTCLWQINGRNEIRDFDEWVALDLEYICDWSLWLDFKILLKTIPAVLNGRGAW